MDRKRGEQKCIDGWKFVHTKLRDGWMRYDTIDMSVC